MYTDTPIIDLLFLFFVYLQKINLANFYLGRCDSIYEVVTCPIILVLLCSCHAKIPPSLLLLCCMFEVKLEVQNGTDFFRGTAPELSLGRSDLIYVLLYLA
jgi:hypothetical protein